MALRTFTPKTPVEIVMGLLTKADPHYRLYGGMIRDYIDPANVNKEFSDIDVVISETGCKEFVDLAETANFVREMKEKTNTNGRRYATSNTTYNVILDIAGKTIEVDLNCSDQEWCDFTCNNLVHSKNIADQSGVATRCRDLTGKLKGLQWIGKCIGDICNHQLVLMCPVECMSMNTGSTAPERRKCINLIRRTMKMMRRGWTLCRHLNGQELRFETYAGTEKCSICHEEMSAPLTAVKIMCGHALHIDCLHGLSHTEGPTSYKCPLCRVHLAFTDRFGKLPSQVKPAPKEDEEKEEKEEENKPDAPAPVLAPTATRPPSPSPSEPAVGNLAVQDRQPDRMNIRSEPAMIPSVIPSRPPSPPFQSVRPHSRPPTRGRQQRRGGGDRPPARGWQQRHGGGGN